MLSLRGLFDELKDLRSILPTLQNFRDLGEDLLSERRLSFNAFSLLERASTFLSEMSDSEDLEESNVYDCWIKMLGDFETET